MKNTRTTLLSAFATLGWVGYLRAPGTAGSLVAAVAGAVIAAQFGLLVLVGAVIVVTIMAFPAIDAHHALTASHDNKEIIIDEVIGQWLVLLAIPIAPVWQWDYVAAVILAFVLFRFFDILKPPPIGTAEDLPGAAGVIADDVLAGAIAGALLMGGFQIFHWWGGA